MNMQSEEKAGNRPTQGLTPRTAVREAYSPKPG